MQKFPDDNANHAKIYLQTNVYTFLGESTRIARKKFTTTDSNDSLEKNGIDLAWRIKTVTDTVSIPFTSCML